MKWKSSFLVTVVCGLLLSIPILVEACGLPGVVESGAVSMRNSSNICLDSAQTVIRLERKSFTVDAVFHLFNPSETTTEKVGYPKRGFADDIDLISFASWINGEKVDFTAEEHDGGVIRRLWQRLTLFLSSRYHFSASEVGGSIEDRWLVHRVTFPGHSRTTLRARYQSKYDNAIANYIYGTKPYWGSPVGATSILVDSTDIGGNQNLEIVLGWPFTREHAGSNLLKLRMRYGEPPSSSTLTLRVHRRP